MPLKHEIWQRNALLNEVAAGKRVLKKGERGKHIEILQAALWRVYFQAYDERGVYGDETEKALFAFQIFYANCFPTDRRTGLTVNALTINTIEQALQRTLTPHSPPQPPAGSLTQRAVAALPDVRSELRVAKDACTRALNVIAGSDKIDFDSDHDWNLVAAFFLHFRLDLIGDIPRIEQRIGKQLDDKLVIKARLMDVQKIYDMLVRMERTTHVKPAVMFYEERAPKDSPLAMAAAACGGPIYLYPALKKFGRNGIKGILIHELVHWQIPIEYSGHTKRTNLYYFDIGYMRLPARRCVTNPDSYTGLVRQISIGSFSRMPILHSG